MYSKTILQHHGIVRESNWPIFHPQGLAGNITIFARTQKIKDNNALSSAERSKRIMCHPQYSLGAQCSHHFRRQTQENFISVR